MSQAPSVTQISRPTTGGAVWLFVIVHRSWNLPADLRLCGSFRAAPVRTENAERGMHAGIPKHEWAGLASHTFLPCHIKQESVISPMRAISRTLLTEFPMLLLGRELLVQNSKTLESIGPGEQYILSLKIMSPLGFATRLPVRAPFLQQAQQGRQLGLPSHFLITPAYRCAPLFKEAWEWSRSLQQEGMRVISHGEGAVKERTRMVLWSNTRTLVCLSWEEQNAKGSSMLSSSEGTIFTSRPGGPSDNPFRIPMTFPSFK